MSPQESVEQLGQLLIEAGFEPEGADLACFWEAFRRWARLAVECERETVSVSIRFDNEGACVELCRDFVAEADEETFGITARFSTTRIDVGDASVVSRGSDRERIIAEVEGTEAFAKAMQYRNWEFEIYPE